MSDIPLIVTTAGSATNAPNAANNTINPVTTAINTLLDTTIPALNSSVTTANTNASAAVTTANTANTAVSGLQTQITANTNNITNLQTTVAGLGAGSNNLFLSVYAGVTPGTTTDSRNGLNNAIQAAAAAGKTLIVDCNVLVTIGTNVSKPIFIPPNLAMRWEPGCAIYTDAVLLPLFVILNSSNITFNNYTVCYTGNFGQLAIDVNNPAGSVFYVLANFNDSSSSSYPTAGLKYYMQQNWGNTFTSGGSASSPGAGQACAQIQVSGAVDNLYFLGTTRVYVPAGVQASYFVPMFMSLAPQWLANTNVTSATYPPTISNAAVPNHVTFDNLQMDGIYMGVCGTCTNLVVRSGYSRRYSDLQDNNGNNVGGQVYNAFTLTASPASPYTSATLASGNWGYATKAYTTTFSDGSTRSVTFTNGSPTITWSTAVASGLSATIQVSYSNNWFAPPHSFYVKSFDNNGNFPETTTILSFIDDGEYVGTLNRRNTGSGYLNSLKVEPANNSAILNYVTNRPDGGADLISFGNQTGRVEMTCNFNSTTSQTGQLVFTAALSAATSGTLTAPWEYGSGTQAYTITFSNGTSQTGTFINGSATVTWPTSVTASATAAVLNTSQQANFFLRFPSAPPTVGLTSKIVAVDNAAEPAGFGWLGDSQIGNTGVDLEIHYTANDVPYGSTWSPGTNMGGNNINLNLTYIYKSMSTTQTYISTFLNAGSTTLTESKVVVNVLGWRAAMVSFTAAPTGTSATLTNWNYGNGTYNFEFEDGETRQVTVTGTSCSWTGALTGTPTATATVLLLNSSNIDSYKNRLEVSQQGRGYGNTIIINDITNGIIQQSTQNLYEEWWTQNFMGPVTGTLVTTGIAFPTTFAVVAYGYDVTTAITGATSLSIGWTGNTTSLVNAGAVAANTNPWGNPVLNAPVAVPVSSAVILTPNAAITAGALFMSVKGYRWQMSG